MTKRTPPSQDARNTRYTVHFSDRNASDRTEVERFIAEVFYQSCNARVRVFLPVLMSLRDLDGQLIAACGIRNAGIEHLYLENYMDQPVEQLLSEKTGSIVLRSDIVEIGNYSVAELGLSRTLTSAIFHQLHATSKQWAVFTAIQLVQNALIRQDIFPKVLCDADIHHLPPEDRAEWGSYYEQNPKVMAIRRMERRHKNRSGEQ
ncbi:MAG: hypothetical protein A2342_07175 [Gallionellales bacterium RIFOXYB12_FULL_54_9]|nr:MAG: hypothetical protein A2342_07175 [Gallionellales bacterium RIFOXYB12_FULL_54_9]